MRICSFFSSATELLYALGAGRSVVGRSDCCDYPVAARRKPVVVCSRVASDRLSSRGIDTAVRAMRRRGEHQYAIDLPLLTRLRPDLVVTQELCNVCAASHPEVLDAIRRLPTKPQVASITVGSLDELLESITALGESIGRPRQAEALQRRLYQDLRVIQHRVRGIRTKPRVWCAEWLDPLMAAGHWVPEMVALAGGIDGLARSRMDSVRLPWEEIRRYDPEVILVMPCSFAMARTVNEFPLLKKLPGWSSVSAVRADRVFAIEGAWFHRSGPRLVQGLQLMAALFHPERFPRPSVSRAKALK